MSLRAQCGPYTVVLREASHADVDGIRNIVHAIYGNGGDYVYDQYHELLHMLQSRSFCIVAEIERKVVGFRFLTLLEDGETVYAGGGRVHPDYERLGIMNLMTKFNCDAYLHRVKPKHIIWTTAWMPRGGDAFGNQLTQLKTVSAVIEADAFRRSVPTVLQLKSTAAATDCIELVALPPHSWQHIVSAEELCKLFPTPSHFVLDHCLVLHRATPSTLPHLINANDQVLISVENTVVGTSSGKRPLLPRAISFSKIFLSTANERAWLFFTLYGVESASEFQRHMSEAVVHLHRRLSLSFQGRIRFIVVCHPGVAFDVMKGFFRDINCNVVFESYDTQGLYISDPGKFVAKCSQSKM